MSASDNHLYFPQNPVKQTNKHKKMSVCHLSLNSNGNNAGCETMISALSTLWVGSNNESTCLNKTTHTIN